MSDETRTLLKYLEEHSLQLKRGTQQTAEAQVEFPKKISSNIVEVSTVVEDFQIPSDIKAIEPPVEIDLAESVCITVPATTQVFEPNKVKTKAPLLVTELEPL